MFDINRCTCDEVFTEFLALGLDREISNRWVSAWSSSTKISRRAQAAVVVMGEMMGEHTAIVLLFFVDRKDPQA